MLDSIIVVMALAGAGNGDRLPEVQLVALASTTIVEGRERNIIAPSAREPIETARKGERKPYQWDINIIGD
jgi:hypothetical protein